MTESQNLRGQIQRLEDELSEAKDDLVRAQKVEQIKAEAVSDEKAERRKSLIEEMLVSLKRTHITISAGDRGKE